MKTSDLLDLNGVSMEEFVAISYWDVGRLKEKFGDDVDLQDPQIVDIRDQIIRMRIPAILPDAEVKPIQENYQLQQWIELNTNELFMHQRPTTPLFCKTAFRTSTSTC